MDKDFDITQLNFEGEWLEMETQHEKFGTLRVRVLPLQINNAMAIIRDDVARYVIDLVADWNLKKDGEPVECNTENKRKYLPTIAAFGIKNPQHTSQAVVRKTVGSEIIAFAQQIENFTKN